jgi:predicted RNA methylase
MRALSRLKNLVVPAERKPRRIAFGPFKGITMELSLHHQSQIYLGLFEREVHTWLERLSRGIHTAIDIGAASGEYTLFFLTRTNAEKVLAFEPDAESLPLLQENLRLNSLGKSGRLEVSAAMVGESDGEEKVTLDSLAGSMKLPCFIKMDVDGAEAEILRGAARLNAREGVRWLIETHSKSLERECIENLRAAGFETRIIRNAWWRVVIPELRPIEQNRWLAAWKKSLP